MELSACIVVYNGCDEALKAAQTVLQYTRRHPLTLYLVDNASPDGSGARLEAAVKGGALSTQPGQKVEVRCRKENGGFGTGHLCMSVLDVNIINIVLPTLSHDFGTSPAVTTWIINGYQLAIVVSLLSFSSLGEIIGYRKVFLSGIGLFCITSLICALSDSFWTLTIARIFQGFSASAITSVNTAQLRYVYPKSQIGRGMGINAMVVAISAVRRWQAAYFR